MRRSGLRSARFIQRGSRRGGGFESTNIADADPGAERAVSLGAQAPSCCSMPASGTQLPIRHGTTTKRRRRHIGPRCSGRSTRSKTGCRICAYWSEEATTEQRAVTAAQHSLDLSNQRYKGGATVTLKCWLPKHAAEQPAHIDGSRDAPVCGQRGLMRALGGGWDVTQLPQWRTMLAV